MDTKLLLQTHRTGPFNLAQYNKHYLFSKVFTDFTQRDSFWASGQRLLTKKYFKLVEETLASQALPQLACRCCTESAPGHILLYLPADVKLQYQFCTCHYFLGLEGEGADWAMALHPQDIYMEVGIQFKLVLKANYAWGWWEHPIRNFTGVETDEI